MAARIILMTYRRTVWGALAITLALSTFDVAHATVIDAVNGNAAVQVDGGIWGITEVGWTYTPTFSYSLTGIFTEFGKDNVVRTVTAEIYDDWPGAAGTLLRAASFTSVDSAYSGASFVPLDLVAGHAYFVGFRNVRSLGVNTTMDANATILPIHYGNSATVSNGTYLNTDCCSYINQPILQFTGDAIVSGVPEPAMPVLVALGLATILLCRRCLC
jgi:hypothetical protein